MKTVKTIFAALLLAVGMTVQAQQVMTVKTPAANDKFQLIHRLVLDLTKQNPEVRVGNQSAVYKPGCSMLIYLMPTEDDVYNIMDGVPAFFNAEDKFYRQITYTRDFTDTNWQLLYLPLRLDYSQWCNDFEVARINDVHQFDMDGDGRIDDTCLEVVRLCGGSTEANTPYVIKAKTKGTKTITQDGATLFATENTDMTVSNWNTEFTVRGTYSTISDVAANTFYAVQDNSLAMASDRDATIGAFRWYITVADRNERPVSISRIRIMDTDDVITGVEEVAPDNDERMDIYDLAGRKLHKVQKGVYIMGGRKVLK